MTAKWCKFSGLALSGGDWPAGPFLGRCECGAVLVIETGAFAFHRPGEGVNFAEWLGAHDAETKRVMAASIKALHSKFGPSNVAENDYNSGAHEAIGQVLDLFRVERMGQQFDPPTREEVAGIRSRAEAAAHERTGSGT